MLRLYSPSVGAPLALLYTFLFVTHALRKGVAGGLHSALTEAIRIKANAVALFTKNQRTWKGSPISAEAIAEFKKTMADVKFDPEMILPHGSYLINLCSPDEGLEKSRNGLLDELKRCEALGIKR